MLFTTLLKICSFKIDVKRTFDLSEGIAIRVREGSIRVREGSIRVREDSIRVHEGSIRVRTKKGTSAIADVLNYINISF